MRFSWFFFFFFLNLMWDQDDIHLTQKEIFFKEMVFYNLYNIIGFLLCLCVKGLKHSSYVIEKNYILSIISIINFHVTSHLNLLTFIIQTIYLFIYLFSPLSQFKQTFRGLYDL